MSSIKDLLTLHKREESCAYVSHVTQAIYIDDYRIRVSFNDGAAGEIDLSAELDSEIFEPLKDKAFFKSFKLEGHTLSWSNGADFAPEFLREQIA